MPIIPANQFNPAALNASGVYVTVITPPGYVVGVPSDVIGVVGTASWGPVNRPVLLGSSQASVLAFGPITAAALDATHGIYDLPTDLQNAFLQSTSQASLQAWGVRVTDGTDTAAFVAVAGAATGTSETATIGGTIAAGDTVSLTATSTGITGSPVTVTYTCVTADTTSTTATGLAAAVNANAALVGARVVAKVSGSVVTLYVPSSLTVTWSEAVTPSSGGPTVTLATGSASTAGASPTAIFTGSGGNNVQVVISAGVQSNTFTATVVPPFGGVAEVFPNLPGAGFWAAFAGAVNSGISAARGPSHILTVPAASVNNAVGAPTPGTYSLATGTDGRGVTTAALLGSQTSTPMTGFYALTGLTPGVGIAWIAGSTDQTLPTLLAQWGESNGSKVLWPFASGLTTGAALTLAQTIGVADTAFDYVKDWVYIKDTSNNVVRQVPPTAIIGGMWATYGPQESWDNKPVYGVLGTERSYGPLGTQPYTNSELGQLQSAGIGIITNPINAGRMWGTWGGRSTSNNSATVPSEYWRLTSYITRSLANFGGQYVSQMQSQQKSDPLRRKLRHAVNDFFNTLYGAGQIDTLNKTGGNAANVICDFSPTGTAGYGINTPTSVSQHYLYLMAVVLYLSSAWYIIMAVEGGTTTFQIVPAGATQA